MKKFFGKINLNILLTPLAASKQKGLDLERAKMTPCVTVPYLITVTPKTTICSRG